MPRSTSRRQFSRDSADPSPRRNSTSSVADPLPEVVALTALPNVRLFPNVPDIRTHLRPACVVVVPLRYGSGSRQKILEAWSMEKCVVSTTVGAEGLAYEDGSNLFIANTVETMASAVVKALRDPALRGRVRHSGRVVAESRHNPEQPRRRLPRRVDGGRLVRRLKPTLACGCSSTCGGCCRESLAE